MKTKLVLFSLLFLGLQQSSFSLCLDNTNISLLYKKSNASEIRLLDVDYNTYRAKYDQLWGAGWRLKDLDVRISYGLTRYSAVWIKSTVSEIQYYGITASEFKTIVADKWSKGWRIFLVANFQGPNSTILYTVVFRPGTSAESYINGYTGTAFLTEYNNKYAAGYRLKALEMCRVKNVTYYTGVFHKSTVSEFGITEWTYSDFLSKYKSLVGSGWRLNTLDSYYNSTSGQFHYTAFFRYEASSDPYVFGYSIGDYEKLIETQWYNSGYNIQFLTLAGHEGGCNDQILIGIEEGRTGTEIIEAVSDAYGNINAEDYMAVSPNPSTDGKFNLSSALIEQETGTVEILKMDGSRVLMKSVAMNGFNADLDLSELQPGIYIMNVTFGEMVMPKKIVIQ